MGSLCEEAAFRSFISQTFIDPSGGALLEAAGAKPETEGDAVPPGSGSGHVPGEGPSQAGMKTPRFQGTMRAPPIFRQKARLPNVSFEEPGP